MKSKVINFFDIIQSKGGRFLKNLVNLSCFNRFCMKNTNLKNFIFQNISPLLYIKHTKISKFRILYMYYQLECPGFKCGVSNENLGVFIENMGSLMIIWGSLNKNMGVSNDNLGVSNENMGSPMKIWRSPTRIWGFPTRRP